MTPRERRPNWTGPEDDRITALEAALVAEREHADELADDLHQYIEQSAYTELLVIEHDALRNP